MGLDIYSSSGVAVTSTKLASIVTEENKELACRTLIRRTATILNTLKADMRAEDMSYGKLDKWDRDHMRSMATLLLTTFESLSIESTVEEVQQMLVKMAPARVDGTGSYVNNSEEALEIWGELIGRLFPEAPKPESTLCIGSPRYQGWDLPLGEPLFVFEESECFERVKTEAGKQLDSMLGEVTKLATWTTYSV